MQLHPGAKVLSSKFIRFRQIEQIRANSIRFVRNLVNIKANFAEL